MGCPRCDSGVSSSTGGSSRGFTQPKGENGIANDDPIAQARARGWHVELRPAGLLIDTNGQPSDPALMDRLHHLALDHDNQVPAWPAHLLANPGEVVLHGELDTIEQACSRRKVGMPTIMALLPCTVGRLRGTRQRLP